MNINLPYMEVYVARWAVTDGKKKEGSERGWLYAAKAPHHKALQFHVLLESGASYWGLPISALKTTEEDGWLSLSDAQLWSNISTNVSVTEFKFLRRMACSVRLRNGKTEKGIYRFTIDYEGQGDLSDTPNEHKCAHIIELDSGHLVAYPNNRVVFNDSSLVKGNAAAMGYKINTTEYLVDETNWSVGETDDYLYRSEEEK
jgi:hypothetical protein